MKTHRKWHAAQTEVDPRYAALETNESRQKLCFRPTASVVGRRACKSHIANTVAYSVNTAINELRDIARCKSLQDFNWLT